MRLAMNNFLRVAAFLAAFAFAGCAEAATCFWVGGAGSWSTANGVNWASGTGGTASTCAATGGVPKQATDIATFDALSGGGTVTVDGTMNGVTMASITMGAFTGTLDFSANNPSMTLTGTFSVTGAGTRVLNLGSGTFTLTLSNGNAWDATSVAGLTFNAGTSTIATSGAVGGTRGFILNTLTYATISLGAVTATANPHVLSGAATIGTLNITAPNNVSFASATTFTITNAFNWAGSSSNQFGLFSSSTVAASTISVASGNPTISWAALRFLTFTGGATFTATNSFDNKSNTGITITPPSGGGGSGHIIGG